MKTSFRKEKAEKYLHDIFLTMLNASLVVRPLRATVRFYVTFTRIVHLIIEISDIVMCM